MVELEGDGTMVVELGGGGAAVVPSKPSRSVGSSRSTGMGEGKSAIRDSVLSCCSTYSKNRDHLNIVTLPFHSGEKHTNSTG